MEWTAEETELLRKMWDEGYPCSAIGLRVNRSASAIAGRAHRIGLPARASPVTGDGPAMTAKRKQTRDENKAKREAEVAEDLRELEKAAPPVRVVKPVVPIRPPKVLPMPITITGTKKCQWPVGEPKTKEFRFCEDKVKDGRPYCKEHCKVAYVGFRE